MPPILIPEHYYEKRYKSDIRRTLVCITSLAFKWIVIPIGYMGRVGELLATE
jgi:hypothetical protein